MGKWSWSPLTPTALVWVDQLGQPLSRNHVIEILKPEPPPPINKGTESLVFSCNMILDKGNKVPHHSFSVVNVTKMAPLVVVCKPEIDIVSSYSEETINNSQVRLYLFLVHMLLGIVATQLLL